MKRVVLAMAVVLAVFSIASAAGMNTHGDLSQRARWAFDAADFDDYAEMIDAHQDAMQAGAVFPDWGYLNGSYPNEAEDAHWNPFIQFVSQYIHDNYPLPWDEATQKLVVFLLGITAHSVADISWHGLAGVDPGLIDAMSDQEFGGDWGAAHSAADTGGEMTHSHSQDTRWIHGEWYIPTADMVEVYHQLGYDTVTEAAIIENSRVQYLGSKAVKYFAWVLFGQYARDTSFLVEQYQDYYKGGLDDMGIWTAWTWENVIGWIENGVPGTILSVAPLHDTDDHRALADWRALGEQYLAETGRRLVVTRKLRGVTLRLTSAADGDDAPVPPKSAPKSASSPSRVVDIRSSVPFSYLGKSILAHDFDGDGFDDVMVGAPGWGPDGEDQRGLLAIVRGGAFNGSRNVDVATGGADWLRTGAIEYGRFGWAYALLDFNDDGELDLAVSSPTVGSDDLGYEGRVEVFFGNGDAGLFSETPDIAIDGSATDTNFGYSLFAADVNGDDVDDLIVGAPFDSREGWHRGSVSIFFSSAERAGDASLIDTDADARLIGEKNYDWFGYTVGVETIGAARRLLVGAPTVQSGDLRAVGRLYGYDPAAVSGGSTTPVFTLTGAAAWEKIGSGWAVGDPDGDGTDRLYVSAPTGLGRGNTPQAGRIYALDADALSGAIMSDDPAFELVSEGAFNYGRYAFRIAFADFDGDGADDWFVTDPWRSDPQGLEPGAAYAWFGGADISTDEPTMTLRDDLPKARFGTAVAFPDFNGDGRPDMAVGAENDNALARQGGLVRIVIYPRPTIAHTYPPRVDVGQETKLTVDGFDFDMPGLSFRLTDGDRELRARKSGFTENGGARLMVSPDAYDVGTWDLTVTTIYGTDTMEDAFIVGADDDDAPEYNGPSRGGDDDDDDGCGF